MENKGQIDKEQIDKEQIDKKKIDKEQIGEEIASKIPDFDSTVHTAYGLYFNYYEG